MIAPAGRRWRVPEMVVSLIAIAIAAICVDAVLAVMLLHVDAELDQLRSDVRAACTGPAARLDLSDFVQLCRR